jgi:hypothetical protein
MRALMVRELAAYWFYRLHYPFTWSAKSWQLAIIRGLLANVTQQLWVASTLEQSY